MKITISVPKPCHENWDAMTQRQKGRHCAQCDHVVADLTRATDAELVALFTSDAKPECARFDPAQLDRALGATEPRHARVFPLAAFTSLVAVAAGHEAVAQGGPIVRPVRLGEPAISRPAPPPPVLKGKVMTVPHSIPPLCDAPVTGDTDVVRQTDDILELLPLGQPSISIGAAEERIERLVRDDATTEVCGTLVDDRTNEPLPFASVTLRFHGAHTETDAAGNFKLQVPGRIANDLIVLDINYSGYEPLSKEVFPPGHEQSQEQEEEAPVSGPIDGDPLAINGFVTEVPKGRLLPGTVVRINGSAVAIRCDERGYFGLRVPEDLVGTEVTLEFDHATAGAMSLPVLTDRLPLFLPVKFMGTPPAPAPENPDGCREVGVLRMQRHYERTMLSTVGGISVVRVYEPTLWQRMTAAFRR
jgi:hypothetical protein